MFDCCGSTLHWSVFASWCSDCVVGVLVVDALLELALFGVDGGHCLVVIENFLSLEMLVVDFLMEDSSFEFPLGFVKCIDDDS